MTTTACDDQFAPEPVEPVRQPYDTAAILRRNVAELEVALKQQTDRAEAAEAELLAVRDDNHQMMLEIDGMRTELAKLREQEPALYMAFSECGQFIRYWTRDTANLDATMAVNDFTVLEFYASPIPAFAAKQAATAPAVPTDEQIHAAYRNALGQSIRERDMPEIRKFARALLQSADHSEQTLEKVDPDCRACANRGRVNGLSQESYCDGCVYQGRSWRKNHFVLAVKRRCEACAILPCSCK